MIQPKKILIVEDEFFLAEMVKDRLEYADFEVLTALDGQEALDIVENNQVDLILLDLMLPEIDGYEVMSQLKENPELKNVPIIVVSARAQATDKDRANSLGAKAYLTKPFEMNDLLATIDTQLK